MIQFHNSAPSLTQRPSLVDVSPKPDEDVMIGELTIVMPCLNEAETLALCVEKAISALRDAGISGEVIVADNGSTDGSREIAVAAGARLVPVPVRGYGAALNAGILAAKTPYILMGDADDSYDFSHAPRFLEELRKGAGLVMGNRFRGGIGPGAMPPLHRYLGNPVLSFLGRLLFHAPVGDFHCGMRAFSREAYMRLNLRTTGMEFASEMVVKAALSDVSMVEVPTSLKKDGRSRPPHLRTWRDGWRHLRFLLMYSPRWLFLYPGMALMLAGLLVAALLVAGPRSIGGYTFDVNTLAFGMASLLLGFHVVLFAVSARIFATTEKLLPPDAALRRLFLFIKLETGLTIGALMFLASLVTTVVAMLSWQGRGYNPAEAVAMLRLTLPAATGMVLGAEICFGSFFLSMMGTRHR